MSYSICKHIKVKRQQHKQTNKQNKGKSVQEESFKFRLKLRKTVSILNFCIERIKQFRSMKAYCKLSDICSTRKWIKGIRVSSIIRPSKKKKCFSSPPASFFSAASFIITFYEQHFLTLRRCSYNIKINMCKAHCCCVQTKK